MGEINMQPHLGRYIEAELGEADHGTGIPGNIRSHGLHNRLR